MAVSKLGQSLSALLASCQHLHPTFYLTKGTTKGVPRTMGELLAVTWHNPEIRGYTDLLPLEWFEKEGTSKNRFHEIAGPRGAFYCLAKCIVKVRPHDATLNYEDRSVRGFNSPKCDLGVLRIRFAGTGRRKVTEIKWRDKGKSTFSREYPTWEVREDFRDVEISEAVEEGGVTLVTHLSRERDRGLAKRKREDVLKNFGKLECEACKFVFADTYGSLGENICEVHHRRPLAKGKRVSGLSKLAILCSNCHRMIHRTSPMMIVEEFASKYHPPKIRRVRSTGL